MKLGAPQSHITDIHSGLALRGSLKRASAGAIVAVQMKDVNDGVLDNPHGLARLNAAGVPPRYLLGAGDLVFRSRGFANSFTRTMARLFATCCRMYRLSGGNTEGCLSEAGISSK